MPPDVAHCGTALQYRAAVEGNAPVEWAIIESTSKLAAIDPQTGVLTWTPSPPEQGVNHLMLQASNAAGTSQQEIDVLVQCRSAANMGVSCGCGADGAPSLALTMLLVGLAALARRVGRLRGQAP